LASLRELLEAEGGPAASPGAPSPGALPAGASPSEAPEADALESAGLPEDAARLLAAELLAVAGGTFLDGRRSPRLTASGRDGFHADDPEADLASWLILCPGTDSRCGAPSAPLREILEAVARGTLDSAAEGRAFLELAASGEAVVTGAYVASVDCAANRLEDGPEGRSYARMAEDAALGSVWEAAEAAGGVRDCFGLLAHRKFLDVRQEAVLGGVAGETLDAILSAGDGPDARASALALWASMRSGTSALFAGFVRRVGHERLRSMRVRFRAMKAAGLFRTDGGEDASGVVRGLLEDGETEAAADLANVFAGRWCADLPAPLLPSPPPPCAAGTFFSWLPWLCAAGDPFALARSPRPSAKGRGDPLKGVPAAPDGDVGTEAVWRRFVSAVGRIAGRGVTPEDAGAVRGLLDWLGFGTSGGFTAGTADGTAGGPLVLDVKASFASPVPAWGGADPEALSVLVWPGGWPGDGGAPAGHGGGDRGPLPPGLAAALETWAPTTGAVPLAIALEPLSLEGWGAVHFMARKVGRDMAVLDPHVMAFIGASWPAPESGRVAALFGAGGVYGRFDPFVDFRPVPGRTGLEDVVSQVSRSRGVVRIEGPPGAGKSVLLGMLYASREINAPSMGRVAVLADMRDPAASSGSGAGGGSCPGPLEAALTRAVGEMDLPGWNPERDLARNLAEMDRRMNRPGAARQVTVMLDHADGIVRGLGSRPGDLAAAAAVQRSLSFRLVLAGRRMSERLESHPASPLYGLPPALVISGPEPGGLAASVTDPLNAMGWVLEGPSAIWVAMSLSFMNPGALSLLAHGAFSEARRVLPENAVPPFTLTADDLRRAAGRGDARSGLRLAALAQLSDPARMAAALAVAARSLEGGADPCWCVPQELLGWDLGRYWPEAFGDGGATALLVAGELLAAGVLSMDAGGLRIRSSAVLKTLASLNAAGALEELRDLPVPPELSLMSARRLLPRKALPDRDAGIFRAGPGGPADGRSAAGDAGVPGSRAFPEAPEDRDGPDAPEGPAARPAHFREGGALRPWAETLLGPDRSRSGGVPPPFPQPSPFTLLQEAALFAPGRSGNLKVTASRASGLAWASGALSTLAESAGCAGPFSVRFVRCRGRDVNTLSVLRTVAGMEPGTGGNRPVHIVADWFRGLSEMDLDGYTALKAAAEVRRERMNLKCLLTYLCPLEELLDGGRPEAGAVAAEIAGRLADGGGDWDGDFGEDFSEAAEAFPVTAGRWTAGALRIWLCACGLDPGRAEGIMEETGGWYDLAVREAAAIMGIPDPASPDPEDGSGAMPRELAAEAASLRGLGPVELPRTCWRYRAAYLEQCFLGEPRVLLAGMGVLVAAGERDGTVLWELDPRFR
ncbi:MAG: hypothetical protein LBQ79_05605, partial [Deltaproteobacteria bacterium]|nr:hypothetical protein [Deltaproteobacteria bacterium]